jgi:hypothetical protein
MSVVFRCKASGNTVTFVHEVDIITTRENPAYEEVVNVPAVTVVEEPVAIKKATVKKTTSKEE